MPQLFLDCDGVLADFDVAATRVFGMPPKAAEQRFGSQMFWNRLKHAGRFYAELPLMPGAERLFRAVQHLHPTILTGCPRGGWAEEQKHDWVERHFPGTPLITSMAREKSHYAKPGDVLVDDMLKYRHLWEARGGIFVHHIDAETTLRALEQIF